MKDNLAKFANFKLSKIMSFLGISEKFSISVTSFFGLRFIFEYYICDEYDPLLLISTYMLSQKVYNMKV